MRVYVRASERWEIELREQQLVTRRFETGALVDQSTAEHATSLRAKWEADRICSRLAAQGFARAGGDDVPALGKAEFEDALRANPDDTETYLVYADWLSEHGDDWGQLIAVQHAQQTLPRFGETARRDELARAETLLRFRLGARLWGALGETIYDEQTQHYLCDLIDAKWHCGFLRTACIRFRDAHVFGALVRGLNELPIGIVLRELTLTDINSTPRTIEHVTERTWLALERLSISTALSVMGDAVIEIDAARIAPALRNAPRLLHLDISGTGNSDELCEAVAASPIVSQLQTLRLRAGVFTEAGVRALSTAKLDSLQILELGATPIEARAKLQHLAPTVRIYVNG